MAVKNVALVKLFAAQAAASAWVRAGAILNPGIKFIALLPKRQVASFEISPAVHEAWLRDLELGRKDGADGRWVWDEDLDRFTRTEEKA